MTVTLHAPPKQSSLIQTLREFTRLFDIYYWKTAVMLASVHLSKQYRNSFLGMIWMLLQPLTMVIIYSIIMPLIMRFPDDKYILYVVTNMPLWMFISGTLVVASNSLLTQGETLKRCIISSTIFPIADVLKNGYTYLISFAVIYAFAVIFYYPFTPSVLLVPLYFIPVMLTVMALSIAIAFIAPYIRDVADLLTVITNFMFWLTPVVYPMSILPPKVQAMMQYNPFYILMRPIQKLEYEGVLPSLMDHLALGGVMFGSIAVSYVIYRICRRNYVYYL